jgi:hypothetical protein
VSFSGYEDFVNGLLTGRIGPGAVVPRAKGTANGSANPVLVPAAPADKVLEYDHATGELRRVS